MQHIFRLERKKKREIWQRRGKREPYVRKYCKVKKRRREREGTHSTVPPAESLTGAPCRDCSSEGRYTVRRRLRTQKDALGRVGMGTYVRIPVAKEKSFHTTCTQSRVLLLLGGEEKKIKGGWKRKRTGG